MEITPKTFCRSLPRAVADGLGDAALPHHLATAHMVKLWSGNMDKGWARIGESIPLEPFDERFATRLTTTLIRYIRVLQPILEDEVPADLPWTA